ncbi:uncharacterized protein DSM5745_01705 [Aspergillus mulundensis]|uniref:Uncharacterized protein n=1 Tax=Aspergillus mulundensis TaxID=1810919 RepID=A0A3D8SUG5_9EURO|nr:hypothetical protein DSM5745_01705 [Aspergillus mulundensis]RDW89930.1 hypothetical protein DSM5745_01705 [Aspergillus mulundensis]
MPVLARNRQGHTALSLALIPPSSPSLSQDSISFGHPAQRGLFLLEKGASPHLLTNSGEDILYWIAENKLLSDEATHNLIITFLQRINTTTSKTDTTGGKAGIHETYQQHFLPNPGALQTLFAAVSRGKLKSTTLLLSLGLHERINELHPVRNWTALDQALSSAETSRRRHIELLSAYKPNTRAAATKANLVFHDDQGPPARAAEAYYAFPDVIRYLRNAGSCRKCEMNSASHEDMDGSYISQPQEWDWTSIYHTKFTPATQPNREQWGMLYALARYRAGWARQVDAMAEDYAYRDWRPDVRFIEDGKEDDLVRMIIDRIGEPIEGTDGAVRLEAEDPHLGVVLVTVVDRKIVGKTRMENLEK